LAFLSLIRVPFNEEIHEILELFDDALRTSGVFLVFEEGPKISDAGIVKFYMDLFLEGAATNIPYKI
jgi:hypothetical protein